MHVSPNIIHFPAPTLTPARPVETATQQDNMVAFPQRHEAQVDQAGDAFGSQLQEFGQLFAAHRIVGRVADELDAVAAL